VTNPNHRRVCRPYWREGGCCSVKSNKSAVSRDRFYCNVQAQNRLVKAQMLSI